MQRARCKTTSSALAAPETFQRGLPADLAHDRVGEAVGRSRTHRDHLLLRPPHGLGVLIHLMLKLARIRDADLQISLEVAQLGLEGLDSLDPLTKT